MDESTLARLQCPITRTPLQLADDTTVSQVNDAIAAGSLRNSDDELVEESIEGGLVNEDKTWLFPIRNSIPSLLVDEAIDLLSLTTDNPDED